MTVTFYLRPCRRHLRPLLIQAIQAHVHLLVARPLQSNLLNHLRSSKCLSILFPKTASNTKNSVTMSSFLLGDFHDNDEFIKFLHVKLPKRVPNLPWAMESFVQSANHVAEDIKGRCEHYLFTYLAFLPTYCLHFRFPKPPYPRVPG